MERKFIPHIVFLTPGFATSEKDSTAIPALQVFLKSLRKSLPNYKMTIIAFQYPFSNIKYNWNSIEVIPLMGKNKIHKKPYTWYTALKTLKKIHCENPISTIHSFWIGECSLIGQKFASKHKLPHITTIMGQESVKKPLFYRLLNPQRTILVSLSENHMNDIKTTLGLPSQIIPWFIEPDEFPEIDTSSIDILGVGSLNKVKNYESFINIIFDLKKIYPEIKAEILGSGILHSHLQNKIDKLKLQNNVTLTGLVSRETVLKKMSKSRILLHTSDYESFGLVFSEAHFSGMKIVSKNVGASKSSAHWKVCNSDIEMTDACAYFLLQSQVKKRILLHSKKDCLTAYEKLYDKAIYAFK